jgi:hypothetical protein
MDLHSGKYYNDPINPSTDTTQLRKYQARQGLLLLYSGGLK